MNESMEGQRDIGMRLPHRLQAFVDDRLINISADKRELILRSGCAFAVKIVSAALAMVLTALITRALGAHEAGYYFWSLALITVLATIARRGFDQVVLRFMSAALADQKVERAAAVFRYAMRNTLWAAIAIAIVLACLSPLLAQWVFERGEVAPIIAVMAAASIFLALNTLQSQSLLADKRVLTSIFVLEIGIPLTMTIIILIAPPRSGIAISAAYLAASALLVAAFGGYWRRRVATKVTRLKTQERLELNRVRTHLFAVASLSLIAQWGGVILLGWFADSAQVALFSIALRVAMLNSFILRAVNAVVGTRFAQFYHREDIDGLRTLALQSSRLMTLVAIPTLLLLLLCAKPLLALFGTEFVGAATCLAILSIGQFINVMTGAVCLLLEMTGGEAQLRRFELISAIALIVLGFLLVPTLGAMGAAIATACAVASVNLLAVGEVKRRFGFNMLKIW